MIYEETVSIVDKLENVGPLSSYSQTELSALYVYLSALELLIADHLDKLRCFGVRPSKEMCLAVIRGMQAREEAVAGVGDAVEPAAPGEAADAGK